MDGPRFRRISSHKYALGIDAVPCETASFRHVPKSTSTETEGVQVDLLFDREDDAINLCELKYARAPYAVTKAYARELKTKVDVFERVTKTRKKIVLTLVSPLGIAENAWSKDLVGRVVTLEPFM